MKTSFRLMAAVTACVMCATSAPAQLKSKAARELAEVLLERFGAKAGRSVPELASRIERLVAKHGDEALVAINKGGPRACELIEAAGPDAAKAVRILTVHGEHGASRVLSQPKAMKQFLQYGDEAAAVLVRHPGVAEPLVERGGMQAVKALSVVDARNGRRMAMLFDNELAQVGRHPELLNVVARHGDKATNFLWQNKEVLAGAAALTAFLAEPEAFINGTRSLAEVAGTTVVKPIAEGIFTALNVALTGGALLLLALIGLMYKFGPPNLESVSTLFSLVKK